MTYREGLDILEVMLDDDEYVRLMYNSNDFERIYNINRENWSPSAVISMSFSWADTPEGHHYWVTLYERILTIPIPDLSLILVKKRIKKHQLV